MTLTTYDDQEAYWTERDWAIDAPIKISSRIDTPKPLVDDRRRRDLHRRRRLGPADGGIEKVEVQIDGGAWQDAELGPDAGDDYWRQWFYRWDAEPGQHRIAAARIDGDGDVQTAVRAGRSPRAPAASRRSIVIVDASALTSAIPTASEPAAAIRTHPSGPPPTHHLHVHRRKAPRHEAPPPSAAPRAVGCRRRSTLSLGLAACGDDADADAPTTTTERRLGDDRGGDPDGAEEPAEAAGAASTFGAAAPRSPTDGAGSFDGMATDPVATAASTNPLLTTLVDRGRPRPAWSTRSTRAEELTVFAPTNDAFAEIPEKRPRRAVPGRQGDADHGPDPPRRRRDARPRGRRGRARDPRPATRSPSRATARRHDRRRRDANVHLRQHPDRQRHRVRHRHGPDAGR